jgi:hypothetical protein
LSCAATCRRHVGTAVTPQSIIADAAEFAVDIGAFRPNIREDSNDAGVFVVPIETSPLQQLRSAEGKGSIERETFLASVMKAFGAPRPAQRSSRDARRPDHRSRAQGFGSLSYDRARNSPFSQKTGGVLRERRLNPI